MIDIKYANAFREVLEILKYIPKSDYEKIPKDTLKVFEDNQNKEYMFNYVPSKTLDEQNVLEGTKVIIGLLYRDYWATAQQRKTIIDIQNQERYNIERKKTKNYEYENIFKQNEKNNYNEKSLIIYKESKFFRLFNRIKKLFGGKK